MKKVFHYIFVDESGDPGKPYKINEKGEKKLTGASLYYVLTAIYLNSEKLFLLEKRLLEIKNKYKYKSELKSESIPLLLYKELLEVINELKIKVYYRLINKLKYKGTFAVKGIKKLHNVFDEYNLAKLVKFAILKENLTSAEVIIDRAERRLLYGKFDSFNNYVKSKVNTKKLIRIKYITHVNSEYVIAMQLSDLVSGALKDYFTKKNPNLKEIINKNLIVKIY